MVFDHLFLPPGTFCTTEFTSPSLCLLHHNCCRWNNLFTFGPRISVRLSWDWGSVGSISAACVRQIGHAMFKYYFCDHPVPTPPPLYDSGRWWLCLWCLQADTIHRESQREGEREKKATRQRRRLGGPNHKKAHSCCCCCCS